MAPASAADSVRRIAARPMLIAHRGAPRERPENTIPAFARALELGADGIELDVHATRDGVVIVHHDPRPNVAPPSPALAGRRIADLTFEELEQFRFEGDVTIPTLADVLALVDGRADVYVEIKGRRIEQQVVDVILQSAVPSRCSVHSFDHAAVKRVNELCPALRTGVLVSTYPTQPAMLLQSLAASDLWPDFPCIGETLVRRAHDAGARVIAWTVDEPDDARRLAALDVDGICTDDIPTIRTALSQTA
ncbi:MAG TPA: glycerophosphodiester phosphodiesterase [Gemmatimonadaceae bacterium]|nr:glycerophosphodiester phosphodiesterase [Gemmatimonadaceae bacterium]